MNIRKLAFKGKPNTTLAAISDEGASSFKKFKRIIDFSGST
jgi:hypothetical protein